MRVLSIMAVAAIAAVHLLAADFAGTWKGSMQTQAGDTEVSITIKPGAALAGTVQAGEYNAPMENAKVNGDKIYFETNIGPGKVSYDGVISGDELKLTVIGTQGNEYKLVCKRQSSH